MYSTDASVYEMVPHGVAIPRNADDVQAIIEVCNRAGAAVLPRGGGTSLSGQTVNHAVVVDFSKYLHNLIEINPEEQWVRTQPGITIDNLNSALKPHGLVFTPDPSTSSRANVGGAMGNNSCGTRSIVYGMTVDHVLEQDVVLSDGTRTVFKALDAEEVNTRVERANLEGLIYRAVRKISADAADEAEKRFPKVMRRVGGYNIDRTNNPDSLNLTQIMVGSEGTLAAVTAAKLNVVQIPQHRVQAVLHFDNLSEAMEATVTALEGSPSGVEHVGSMVIDNARQSLGFARGLDFLQGNPTDLLVVEFSGDEETEVLARLDALEASLRKRSLSYATTRLTTAAQQNEVSDFRKASQGLLMIVPGQAKPLAFVEDTAVSPEKLPEYVRRFDEIVKSHGTEAGYYGHASVGCLHIRPMINLRTADGIVTFESMATEISDLVQEFGGSMSGEHGDGIVRGVWTEKMFGSKLTQAFRDINKAFDPSGIMNPGKIFDTPPLTSNLRYGATYSTADVRTRLDFTQEEGFAASIESCIGLGECRRTHAGAMCPSYMATREETHSTRGRANTLRFALTGRLPLGGMASQKVFDVLDYCLECKSCKAECPIGVDMAKIKYEFLDQYYREHRRPLRTKMVGEIHRLSAITSPVAPIANAVNRSFPARWLLEKTVGFDRSRPAPTVVRNTFQKWFDSHQPATTGARGDIVLFHDTFTNFNHPEIGIASTHLLEALGFTVTLVRDRKCCGRPMISKGMLDKAAVYARHNVDLLAPHAERGIRIVGLEASCVSAMRDDWPDLLGNDSASTSVADATVMLEEIIADTSGDDRQQIPWSNAEKDIRFFGHCHQRALTGTSTSLTALNLPPGYTASEISAGCCGMAGSFGYEREHVELATAIGEDRLFPAVREAAPEVEIAITGVSCRDQIGFNTQKKPRHLAEILADAL